MFAVILNSYLTVGSHMIFISVCLVCHYFFAMPLLCRLLAFYTELAESHRSLRRVYTNVRSRPP
jgi:hypothetical protein